MKMIINHTSMQPIYEQIVDQIKAMIIRGELKAQEMLPSVRTLSKELKISALTVKNPMITWNRKGLWLLCMAKAALLQIPIRVFWQKNGAKRWKRIWSRQSGKGAAAA